MFNNRGAIHNRPRAKQLRDYSGLRFGKITPTDIDGLIEYKNKAYVILELKYGDTELPFGQRLALERLTDDLEQVGKPTLCIVATHDTHDCNKDIDAANTIVTKYRLKREWIPLSPDLEVTTRTIIELFLNNLSVDPDEFMYLCINS